MGPRGERAAQVRKDQGAGSPNSPVSQAGPRLLGLALLWGLASQAVLPRESTPPAGWGRQCSHRPSQSRAQPGVSQGWQLGQQEAWERGVRVSL